MSLGRRLKERREEIGMTQEDVGRRVGLSKSTIGKYEKGILSNIPSDNIEKLANALDTSPAYLMGWRTDRSRSAAIPLLGTIAAGTPILAEENITEYFNLDSSIRADFALRVRGDSMIEAGIFPDDIAFFKKQETLENGQVGAVLIDNEATLKTFYRTNDSIILQPANKKYPPIILTEDIRILGLLVAVLNRRDV